MSRNRVNVPRVPQDYRPTIPLGSPIRPPAPPMGPPPTMPTMPAEAPALMGSFAPAPEAAPPLPSAPSAPPPLPSPPPGVVQRVRYKPFAKENRQDALLAIGTGFLAHPESFSAGAGAAGENLGQLRSAYIKKSAPHPSEIGGPDNAFEITTDPMTGERTYAPITQFTDYEKDKERRKLAPKPHETVDMRANTMAAVLRLPKELQPQAYSDFVADSGRLGYDLGLPPEWNPDVARAMSNQGIGASGLATADRAEAATADRRTNSERSYNLRVQNGSRADARLGLARRGAARADRSSSRADRKEQRDRYKLPPGF